MEKSAHLIFNILMSSLTSNFIIVENVLREFNENMTVFNLQSPHLTIKKTNCFLESIQQSFYFLDSLVCGDTERDYFTSDIPFVSVQHKNYFST